MSSQVTVTARTGPAIVDTADVLRNVDNINFNLAKRVMTVDGKEYDLSTVTTVTFSISGRDYTIAVS